MRFVRPLLILLAIALWLVPPAQARPFDLIYVDHAEFTTLNLMGIRPPEYGYAIVVNTGTAPITREDWSNVQASAVSSVPGFEFIPYLTQLDAAFVDLAPGLARGPSLPLLQALLGPREYLDDTRLPDGYQFFTFDMARVQSDYEGPVTFHVTLDMIGSRIEFDVLGDMRLGGTGEFAYLHASRKSASPLAVTASSTTWGRIKSLHR